MLFAPGKPYTAIWNIYWRSEHIIGVPTTTDGFLNVLSELFRIID